MLSTIIYYFSLFLAKVADNALSTARTILVQRSRCVIAGVAAVISNMLYFWITKKVVSSDGILTMLIVSVAGGVGCTLACFVSEKLSRDRAYVNVVMSDDIPAMQAFRGFLAAHHITNVVSDSYTKDWKNSLTITAYAETKEQSRLIDSFISGSALKYKRVIQKT